MMSVAEGESIDIKSCGEMNKMLIDDVAANIDKIKGINKLKIYDRYTFSHTINVSSMSTALGMVLNLNKKRLINLHSVHYCMMWVKC